MDIYSDKKRKDIMGSISSKNTKPEIIVRSYLHERGYRYRLHKSDLPGKPDITLKKYNSVIFVNGCFWHGHKNCSKAKLPKVNKDFWVEKINYNRQRDRKNYDILRGIGWTVIIIWECELTSTKKRKERLNYLEYELM